jgi:hypothetical protein
MWQPAVKPGSSSESLREVGIFDISSAASGPATAASSAIKDKCGVKNFRPDRFGFVDLKIANVDAGYFGTGDFSATNVSHIL